MTFPLLSPKEHSRLSLPADETGPLSIMRPDTQKAGWNKSACGPNAQWKSTFYWPTARCGQWW